MIMYSDYEYLTKLDLSKYAGKWVAVCDSRIAAILTCINN